MRRRKRHIEESLPHNITSVVAEFDNSYTGFNVPQHAGHITRAGEYLSVIDKPAATEVTGVGTQFAGASNAVGLAAVEIVNGTDIVETTAGDEIPRWRVCTSHDPTRPEGNCMDLVGGISVPNDQLAVL